MKIGYARVSTQDQNLDIQIADLKIFGCEKIYREKVSGVKERPELKKMIETLREGDVVCVWKIDRLGRSIQDLLELIKTFKDKSTGFVSLQDSIDLTTIQGRLAFNILAVFAEFERELIRERTIAGLRKARENGRIGGKKPGLSPEAKIKARNAYRLNKLNNNFPKEERQSVEDICKSLGISRATFYRYLDWAKKEESEKTIKKNNKK